MCYLHKIQNARCNRKDNHKKRYLPIPVAARSKAQVYNRLPVEIMGSNPTGSMDVCLLRLLCVVQVEVSVTGWSLVQRSPTDCGASLCVTKKPREWGGHGPLGGCRAKNKRKRDIYNCFFRSQDWLKHKVVVFVNECCLSQSFFTFSFKIINSEFQRHFGEF